MSRSIEDMERYYREAGFEPVADVLRGAAQVSRLMQAPETIEELESLVLSLQPRARVRDIEGHEDASAVRSEIMQFLKSPARVRGLTAGDADDFSQLIGKDISDDFPIYCLHLREGSGQRYPDGVNLIAAASFTRYVNSTLRVGIETVGELRQVSRQEYLSAEYMHGGSSGIGEKSADFMLNAFKKTEV